MRIAALLLGLAALAQPVRAESDLLICRMTGDVMRACCCPATPRAAPDAVHKMCCCDSVHMAASASPSRADGTTTPPLVGQSAMALALPPRDAPSVSWVGEQDVRTHRSTGPPRVPIYISLRRLLD